MMLLQGDCLERLKELADNSVDSIVTDPPYGLSFMGKKWDYDVPSRSIWIEALRVLKPGGHLLSFGGTRTYHRMVVVIEDAGFEIRDQIQWIYGSGFPKSHDLSKAIDKAAGAEREVIGPDPNQAGRKKNTGIIAGQAQYDTSEPREAFISAPTTDAAKQWQGWGTALKPANEPIVVARKPLEKGLTIAENVLKYGTGALNIDASRIETTDNLNGGAYSPGERVRNESAFGGGVGGGVMKGANQPFAQPQGRWPANVIFDEEAVRVLDEQSGKLSKQGSRKLKDCPSEMFAGGSKDSTFYGDSGGASRFFYVAKASKKERNAGLEGMPIKKGEPNQELGPNAAYRQANAQERARGITHVERVQNQNHHPTVKPIKLMEYLINLVSPPNGSVLDPFMGSGSTGVAARNLNREFIGIELNEEYFNIAKKRISQ